MADGQGDACEQIVSARDSFEHLPLFFASDQEEFKSQVDPSKIDEWMSTASQIATGGRRQVPEDSPDVINSEQTLGSQQTRIGIQKAPRITWRIDRLID
jgi:hypothetical protein